MVTTTFVRPCEPDFDLPPPVGAVPDGSLVYAVGDIHGRLDLLDAMHEAIAQDAKQIPDITRRVIVYLGDYVSRGPHSRRVLDCLLTGPPAGFEAVYLRGNHEDIVSRALDGDVNWGRHWLKYGGVEGMADYGLVAPSHEPDEETLVKLMDRFRAVFPDEHRAFLDGLAIEHREGDYCFVHAGARPGVPLDEQNFEDRIWIRDEFLRSEHEFGAVIVHGHCIFDEPQVRTNRISIDTGACQSGVLTALGLRGDDQWFLQTHTHRWG